ncbi:ABC transporter permease subunit [Corynebacterium breve]|uniref:ABC transporter permease subunit n=1 Tax=Corynebacterium breve TaxID=3049799 RepID=A0ABY8VE56_9CORY|nr:ABC transporter permease subunit [Corynebacterium breve]WIM67783.1 ABC transporter permease subunit [Corynebacterium breve]
MIFSRLFASGWRGLVGWAIGIAAVLFLYLPLYPSLQTPELAKMIEALPPEMIQAFGYDQISSGPGYAQATFFGLLGFVLAVIACITWGTSFIAGAEESGDLELTLAHAVGRKQYAWQSALALVARMAVLAVVVFVLLLGLNEPSELELSTRNMLAVVVAWAGLGLLAGAASLAVGALTGRRSWAIGAGTAVAVVGYICDAIASMNADFDWLAKLSPFYWAYGQTPLVNGFDWGGLALLWGSVAALVVVAVVALDRRDITG